MPILLGWIGGGAKLTLADPQEHVFKSAPIPQFPSCVLRLTYPFCL